MLTRLLEYNDQILHIFSFFFNDTATTEIYTLSLHDALPISDPLQRARDAEHGGNADRMGQDRGVRGAGALFADEAGHVLAGQLHREPRPELARHDHRRLRDPLPQLVRAAVRSEEHTSELQSPLHLVC